jgi:hypothetical protein
MSRHVERDEGFDDMLNDCYEPYKIGDLVFYPADILYNCDPIAYSISVSEYEDYEQAEAEEDEVNA